MPISAYLMDFCYPETMVLVSPAVLEEGNYQSMNGVVGTGPYVYEEIVDGDYVRFVRNENYWGEQPYCDEGHCQVVHPLTPRLRLQALQSGEIDLIYGSAVLHLGRPSAGPFSQYAGAGRRAIPRPET